MNYTRVEDGPQEDENAITSIPPRGSDTNPVIRSPSTRLDNQASSPRELIQDGTSRPTPKAEPPQPQLRYRRRTIYLLLFYIPLLILPWVFTCILSVRPLNAPSYTIQWGGLSPMGILSIASWLAAVRVLNSVASLVTIPLISTLLAQAAIVYAQRRRQKQSLSIRQVFALADRGWSDITILWSAFGSNKERISSRFLWFGATLIAVSAIQQPIQQLLVFYVTTSVMTCIDLPWNSCDPMHFPISVGFDPEPGDMAMLPQNIVVQDLANKLATFSEMNYNPRMWPDNPYTDGDPYDAYSDPANRQQFFWYGDFFDRAHRSFFVTAMENGTTTGVLREHVMRLNSSVQCNNILRSEFPSSCPGARPFTTSYNSEYLDIRVCAPGEYGVFAWNLTRNRQDLPEELFIDVSVPNDNDSRQILTSYQSNYTIHCTAATTRGYFELGNYRNNFSYGPLIDKWPTDHESVYEFNDYLDAYADFNHPSANDTTPGYFKEPYIDWGNLPPDPFGTSDLIMSGPLMTSAIAIFGNESFFNIAVNSSASSFNSSDLPSYYPTPKTQICQQRNIPFSRYGLLKFFNFQDLCYDIDSTWYRLHSSDEYDLADLLFNWINGFNDTIAAQEALRASMFLANEAMLMQTADWTGSFSARKIFTSPGTLIPRPAITLASKILVSVLIFLQLVGLAVIAWYIYRVPTWAPALDALAVARIGKSLKEGDLPPIGPVTREDVMKLTKVDGLVGVITREEEKEEEEEDDIDGEDGDRRGDRDEDRDRDSDGNRDGHEDGNADREGDVELGRSNSGTAVATGDASNKAQAPFRLGLGASGLINRALAPKKEKKRTKGEGQRERLKDRDRDENARLQA